MLELPDGTLQVGCEADRGLRWRAAPEGTRRLLEELTGRHTPEDLAVRCGLAPADVDEAVAALARHRLLAVDDPQAGPLGGTAVARVVSTVPLALDVALALLRAGVGEVHVVDARGAGSPLAQAVRRRERNPDEILERIRVVDHLGRRRLPPGTPTVVATGHLEVDPALATALLRADDPHVVARPRPAGVLLGPFVLPGRTSCLACADLARSARDTSWVAQRAGLTTTRAPYPAALVPWAVSTLLAQLACWAADGLPDLVDRTVEMGTSDWRQRWRAWRAHPRCGCR